MLLVCSDDDEEVGSHFKRFMIFTPITQLVLTGGGGGGG